MKYLTSFSKMDSEFASRALVDGLESIDEMENRRALVFENSAFFHRVVGLWPKEDQILGRFRAIKCYTGILSTITIALMQFSVFTQSHDKSRKPELFIEAVLATSGCIKLLPCILKRKSMINLYHKTREINSYLRQSSAEKKITYKWLSLQIKLISFGVVSYTFIVCTYFLYPLYKGDTFPIQGVVPLVFHQFPWIIIVYTVETIMSMLRLIVVVSCDTYLVIFMSQLCCELQIVGQSMLSINKYDKRSVYDAIEKHKRALEYGQMICDDFSSAMVIQFLMMSIGLCFAAISVLYTKNQILLIKFISIAIITVSEILLLCFVGETIAGESLKIADHLENIYQQFLDDTKSMRTISFMLRRAQRPLMLKVGNNTIINLNLFRLTINKIFSCFVILKRAIAE